VVYPKGTGGVDRASGRLALAEDRARAEPLLAELRAGRRLWEDLTGGERRRISPAALVDYLLEASFACRFADPARMVALAEAACAVADRLTSRRYGRELTADLRARAWAELGNAYRVVDDLGAAGPALARAQKLASEGTRSSSVSARIAEQMASYLIDLREFGEAVGLLEQAEALYGECGDRKGREGALLSLAHALSQGNDPERAVIIYLRVLQNLGPDGTNRLALVHGLAANLVECGLFELAEVLVKKYTRLYKKSGRLNENRRFWLEGKIAAGLHDYGKAEGKLQTARYAFLRVRQTYDASLVALDLALVYAKQGRRDQVEWLVKEMLRTFSSLGIARESIASLVLLKKSCEQRRPAEILCGQIETLAKLLPELVKKTRSTR
jgi:tetratricopeptide (TPR) repeat protein